MRKEITVNFYIGNTKIDRLTPEQKDVMTHRMSDALSLYYTAHPEEYSDLADGKRG